MEHIRKIFAHAQQLMHRYDALKDDISGCARQEQLSISANFAALPFPTSHNGDEWNIAMTSGAYYIDEGTPVAEFFSEQMRRDEIDMINQWEAQEAQEKAARAKLYSLFPALSNPDDRGHDLHDGIPF